jgi:transcriptional regulator with XRE-family HTH domain
MSPLVKKQLVKKTGKKDPFVGLGMGITLLRMRAGWTQKEFARRLKMDAAFLSRLERDKQRPSVETLSRLLNTLGVSLRNLDDAMLFARGEDIPREFTVRQLVEGTTSVTDELRQLAEEVAKVLERRQDGKKS